MKKLLIIDDDQYLRKALADGFSARGYEVTESDTLLSSYEYYNYAVIDLKLKTESGMDAIGPLIQKNPNCRIIVLTGYGSIPTAVEAVRKGAYNYLKKPAGIGLIELAFTQDKIDEQKTRGSEIPTLDQNETDYIQFVLNQYNGNITQAAKKLGLHRQSLQRKLKKYT